MENEELELDDLELDEDQDDGEESQHAQTTDQANLAEENERLRRQNEKLKLKKRKAIEVSSKKAVLYDDLEQFYQTKKAQETFERDYPGVDYDVVQAIAERKKISMDDALGFLGNAGKAIVGREVTQPAKKTDAYFEARKKALGLA